jgi:hypothetical protein
MLLGFRMLCDAISASHSVLAEFMVGAGCCTRGMPLGLTMLLRLKPLAMRDLIGVVAEFMVDVSAVESPGRTCDIQ